MNLGCEPVLGTFFLLSTKRSKIGNMYFDMLNKKKLAQREIIALFLSIIILHKLISNNAFLW
jgi:hypothetical protein